MTHKHSNSVFVVQHGQRGVSSQQCQRGSVGARDVRGGDGAPPVVISVLAHGAAVDQRPHLPGNILAYIVRPTASGLHQVDALHAVEALDHLIEPSLVLEGSPITKVMME